MTGRLEQFSIGVGEHKGGVQYDAVSREMQSYQQIQSRYQDSRNTDSVLPRVKLSDEGVKHQDESARKEAVVNASKQFPSLMKKAGVQGEHDGLNHDELIRLKKMTDLSVDERRAVDFMLTNYDKLNTRRLFDGIPNHPLIRDYAELLQRRRITPDSLLRYSQGTSAILEEVKQADPREVQDAMRDSRRKTDGPGKPREGRPDDIVVKEGWGWWQVAREYMKVNKIPYSLDRAQEITRHLQELNPDKVKMLHPNDRIITRRV